MKRRTLLGSLPALALLPAHALEAFQAPAASTGRVFELRVYHANPGKLDALLARFRDHTMHLFERHGMKNIAYWVPTDEPLAGHTLIYVLGHASREAAAASWAAFQADPEWQQVRDASEAQGKLVEKVDSTYMKLTDFSPSL